MPIAGRKRNVRRSLERLLFPALEARGFVRTAPAARDNLAPFGVFTRTGARGIDVLEIQFDKYNPAHFRVNLAVMRPDWKPGDPPAHVDGRKFCLKRWGLPLRRWFGVRGKAGREISEAEHDAVVQGLIDLLPQVDRLFARGRRSWRMEEYPEPLWVPWIQILIWTLVAAVAVASAYLLFRAIVMALRAAFSG